MAIVNVLDGTLVRTLDLPVTPVEMAVITGYAESSPSEDDHDDEDEDHSDHDH